MTLPDWFNSIDDIPVVITILAAFFGAVLWVINQKIEAIKHEVQPNSGRSMKDTVDRIEAKLDQHIHWHLSSER